MVFIAVKICIVIVWVIASCTVVGRYVWKEPTASKLRVRIFSEGDRGNVFFRNVGTHVPGYKT